MENSAEALKIAFAIFIFVVALTTVFMVLSQGKQAADTVFYYTDKTNFQTPYNGGGNIVGVDDLIATLFRYYTESISVKILDNSGNIVAIFDTAIEKNCPWSGSNELRDARIKEFVTGNDVDDRTGIFDTNNTFDYTAEANYTPSTNNLNVQLKPIATGADAGKYVNAKMSLSELCNNNLQNATFSKTFVEATVGGEYHTPSNYQLQDGTQLTNDGTSIQITPGTKKVYITYELQP